MLTKIENDRRTWINDSESNASENEQAIAGLLQSMEIAYDNVQEDEKEGLRKIYRVYLQYKDYETTKESREFLRSNLKKYRNIILANENNYTYGYGSNWTLPSLEC